MNGKAAKRIRYAADCMFGKTPSTEKASARKAETIRRLKREYCAAPYHRRDVHQESHSFVLQVKYGSQTRKHPA